MDPDCEKAEIVPTFNIQTTKLQNYLLYFFHLSPIEDFSNAIAYSINNFLKTFFVLKAS